MAFCVLTSLVQELSLTLELEVHTHTVIFFFSPKVYTLLEMIRQEINSPSQRILKRCSSTIVLTPLYPDAALPHFYPFPSVLQLQFCMMK